MARASSSFTISTLLTKAINDRHCFIRKLTSDQVAQVGPGSTLVMPTLNAWSKITRRVDNPTSSVAIDGTTSGPPYQDVEVELEVFPDSPSSARARFIARTTSVFTARQFRLIGEPTVLLAEGHRG